MLESFMILLFGFVLVYFSRKSHRYPIRKPFFLISFNQKNEKGSSNEVQQNKSTLISSQKKENVKLEVKTKDSLGKYLTDSEGKSLYIFLNDASMKSNCYGDCAEVWPPLLTEGKPSAGNEINSSMILLSVKMAKNRLLTMDGPYIILRMTKKRATLKGRTLKDLALNGISFLQKEKKWKDMSKNNHKRPVSSLQEYQEFRMFQRLNANCKHNTFI